MNDEADDAEMEAVRKSLEASTPILRFFSFAHLPERLRDFSRPICATAVAMAQVLPAGPETTAGLRKLLEAKDCFVRAAL